MQVWKITQEGMGGILYLESLDAFENILGTIEDQELGCKITAEVTEMDAAEFKNLPEFECFE